MHWVIQDSPYREEGHYALREHLERFGIPFTEVKMIPFVHELVPEVTPIGPTIVMGSVSLAKVATERGWIPGTFTNDNFSYDMYIRWYGTNMLNYDSVLCELGEVEKLVKWNEFFIRPMLDMKQFGGMKMSFGAVNHWADAIRTIEQSSYTTIRLDTKVVCAPLKDIAREYRYFVVNGRVVTGSRYKLGDRVVYSTDLDDSQAFAQKMVDQWQPDRAFVLDLALTEQGYKVLEVNCINSAGYYAADIGKLVHAIESMGY